MKEMMIIKIEGNCIIFKSSPENFHKEKEGLKSCTIRRIELWSEMKEFEIFYNKYCDVLSWTRTERVPKIRIINTETRESFERTLTDISQFEGLWVFSWRVV